MSALRSLEELRALRARIADLPEVRARVAQRAAEKLGELAREAFDARRGVAGDPFGTGADGKPITLQKSGRLRAQALSYQANGTQVRASVGSVPYAKYHLGKGILPASGAPLPAAWEAEIDAIAKDEIAQHLGGAR